MAGRKRNSAEDIVRELRRADELTAAGKTQEEIAAELEVSAATLYNWRRQYGGMDTDAAKELKELREQNGKLKRLLAEAELEKDALREVALENSEPSRQAPRRRRAREHHESVETTGVQSCWACPLHVRTNTDRRNTRGPRRSPEGRVADVRRLASAVRLPSRLGASEARRGLVGEQEEGAPALEGGGSAGSDLSSAQTRRHQLLPQIEADAPKVVWAMEFQFDSTVDGKAIKIAFDDRRTHPAVPVEHCGALDHRAGLTDELDKTFALWGGPPLVLRMDNGPEFNSHVLQQFCRDRVGISYIPPGTPWNNGHIESFNNRLRKECLNRNHWTSLLEARVVIEDFKDDHNHRHRHSSLGYLTPSWGSLPLAGAYAAHCTHNHQPVDGCDVD